ncbi:MAG: type II secretion system protein GspE [Clostridiales bacterium GWB2_37_7]|nr:MAG: type II secretion system protein GspE [Clostridiales bacterium GWB2_37_7]
MINRNKRLGDLLVDAGLLTDEQLKNALDKQKATGKKLGEILIDDSIISESDMIRVLELQLGIAYMDISKISIDPEIPKLINENLARRHNLIPIKKENNRLIVAMADPLNIFARDDVSIATGLEVEPVTSSRLAIISAIEQYYGKQRAEKAIEEFKRQYDISSINELMEENINETDSAPVVRLINSIISQAVKLKASDIHVEPAETKIRIRFRIDGELQEVMNPEKSALSAIITRIKIMGKMDIAEKRIPQDGRIELTVDNKEIDMRISSIPTVFGEKIVIRLLDRENFLTSKKGLGFSETNMALLDKLIKFPNGIILVTGPTGSGKSTTLYALLKELNKSKTNIITIEDPVEYRLDGINQVQVNTKAGMTFASGLRSILRQDPDIIMVGEIRDAETAQIAVRASITGHLVLSTMHTNDAASTVARLVDMGIEPYLVSASVVGVIAQRLVRKICNQCKTTLAVSSLEKELLHQNDDFSIYKGRGCSACNGTGYKGRTAIHEIMPVDRDIRTLIEKRASIDVIRTAAAASGTISLRESCKQLVLQGITTIEEMIRVTYSLD